MKNVLLGWIEGTVKNVAEYKEFVIFQYSLYDKKLSIIPLSSVANLNFEFNEKNSLLKYLKINENVFIVENENIYSNLKYYNCFLGFNDDCKEIYNQILSHSIVNQLNVNNNELYEHLTEALNYYKCPSDLLDII